MRRATVVGLILVLVIGARSRAEDGAPPPPLAAPVDLPPVAVPPLPAGGGPVLAVPGLPSLQPTGATSAPAGDTTPGGIPLASPALELPGSGTTGGLEGPAPLVEPGGTADDLGGPPPLVGPADLGGGGPVTSPLPAPRYSAEPPPGMGRSGLTLEPATPGALSGPAGRPTPTRTPPGTIPRAGSVGAPPALDPPPRGRRLFGVVPLPSLRGGRPAAGPTSAPAVRLDDPPALDPEAADDPDVALERRIRTQIRSSLGDHVRAVDVRVVDREVYIRAQVSRFWQKRAVRRSLETMPLLTGYRAQIYVD